MTPYNSIEFYKIKLRQYKIDFPAPLRYILGIYIKTSKAYAEYTEQRKKSKHDSAEYKEGKYKIIRRWIEVLSSRFKNYRTKNGCGNVLFLCIETRTSYDNEGENNNVIEAELEVPTSHPKALWVPLQKGFEK